MVTSPNNWKGPQRAPRQFGRLLQANFPQITKTGIYEDRFVAGTTKKSSHAEGRAIDIHLNANDPDQKALGDGIVAFIVQKAPDMGVDNVIWNRQIWSVQRPKMRRFTGKSPHIDHIHVEFTRKGSQLTDDQLLNAILIDVGIIRTGIEDLQNALRNLA